MVYWWSRPAASALGTGAGEKNTLPRSVNRHPLRCPIRSTRPRSDAASKSRRTCRSLLPIALAILSVVTIRPIFPFLAANGHFPNILFRAVSVSLARLGYLL
jgi:hypothetical protein